MPQMDDFWEDEAFIAVLISFSGFLVEDEDSLSDLIDDDDELNVSLIGIV